MTRRLLVVSTVHPPDDPRIRRKLIGTLQGEWDVTFAGRGPGPTDRTGITWHEFGGGRFRRWLSAGRVLFGRGYDVASLHDPELLPLGYLASLLGRAVVFDVHENVPAQIRTKQWIPRIFRRPLASLFGWLLHRAEKRLAITLAEPGYGDLFHQTHPVFPNYLVGGPPSPRPADPETGIVYLGDVTEARGLTLAVSAAASAGVKRMSIIGRCPTDYRSRLVDLAASGGLELQFHGFLPLERALGFAAGASLGLSPLLDIPNYRHSLPTKVLEYLAVGVPTLASDLPGTREVIAGKPGVILLPPGDQDAWAEAIAAASTDQSLRLAAVRGVPAILGAYMWPEDEVRSFYRSLV